MGTVSYSCVLAYLSVVGLVVADTYMVNIFTEQYVNLVDSRFLSFTVDPRSLFSTSEKYRSKECICMASSLAPAFLRIAGPSTPHLSFNSTTLHIKDVDADAEERDLDIEVLDADTPKKIPIKMNTINLAVTHKEWRKFIRWAKATGYDLVFAMNNEERTASGMWDPNTALNMLTVAEKAEIGDIFWELGYECKNQSMEEYLNDLETLRVILDTFPPRRTGEWKAVAGDVTSCLQADSKSDFRDYITLSDDLMDALLLNGNSTYQELQRMSERNRLKLMRLLSHSNNPLWLMENKQRGHNQLERAIDWLVSLGYAAKNGFSVHYRELEEHEIHEPTLSFYMALLFKNLVGERVLNVEMVPEQAIIFGHCTSLRQKPVPGAVTLFGVNMDDEPARFSLKLPKREEGGDVLQFILGYDHNGNIAVNGRAMYYEGDIRPVVKRVRPFKTLLVTLPAKSFGFWVLANTQIEACQDIDYFNKTSTETRSATESVKVKRSVDDDFEEYKNIANLFYDFDDKDTDTIENKALKQRVVDLNRDLSKIQGSFYSNKERLKREDDDNKFAKVKLRRPRFRAKIDKSNIDFDPKGLLNNILQRAKQSVDVLKNKGLKEVKRRINRNKVNKRHSRNFRVKTFKKPKRYFDKQNFERTSRKYASLVKNKMLKPTASKVPQSVSAIVKPNIEYFKHEMSKKNLNKNKKIDDIEEQLNRKNSIENEIVKHADIFNAKSRRRRDVVKETEELSTENEIDLQEKKNVKLWNILKKLHDDMKDFTQEVSNEEIMDSAEGILLQTELSDDTATIKVRDSSKGLIQSTMSNMVNALEDLNKNFNRFWDTLGVLG